MNILFIKTSYWAYVYCTPKESSKSIQIYVFLETQVKLSLTVLGLFFSVRNDNSEVHKRNNITTLLAKFENTILVEKAEIIVALLHSTEQDSLSAQQH